MALDKAIKSGDEHRQEYRRSKAFDSTCRNHGGCGYCEDTRTYQDRRARLAALDELAEIAQEMGFYDE